MARTLARCTFNCVCTFILIAQSSLGVRDSLFLSHRTSIQPNNAEDSHLNDTLPDPPNNSFVGDQAGRCDRVWRPYHELPPHFMSGKSPFAEPTAQDFASAKTRKIAMTRQSMKRLKTQLWMLDTVVGLLRKHGVHFWMEAGTLLGAYRGGGFIPWDDDMDLTVPISFQPIVLGPVKDAAAKHNIKISQLYFPPFNPSYQPAVGYIQRHAPRIVAHTHAYNQTLGTSGYFVQALYGNLKLDLWQAFPVVLDGMVMYMTAAAGSTLFSKPDVYPLKQCNFEGRSLPCPARTHRYLVGIYKEIALPNGWRGWWDPQYCAWDGVKAYKFKEVRYLGEKDPDFATLTCDATGF
eukprot:gnl/MRDRNA2_/MRDRNA2_33847_c0_seq2.p1 gnl/MRDRNA2_/MRDRNA2_33847_c0~~gnl/MRDRNA2_/MRDRNA2_33847_c0_seq2.p1  ORF type:complete len:349 (-),score=50.62 gnl/MRDRNA2_/MRDRNA2_33847_c0_seq2:26-1072(-)